MRIVSEMSAVLLFIDLVLKCAIRIVLRYTLAANLERKPPSSVDFPDRDRGRQSYDAAWACSLTNTQWLQYRQQNDSDESLYEYNKGAAKFVWYLDGHGDPR